MRLLLPALVLGSMSPVPAPDVAAPSLRVLTYNVHAWGPVASTDAGKARARDVARHGQVVRRVALEIQLYDPDVIALQEAASEARVKELAAMLGMDYAYFPGGWKGRGWKEGISGAILSRLKILERENRPGVDPEIPLDKLFSRCLGRVVVEFGAKQLAVYGAHMLPSWKNTTHIREAEIRALSVGVARDRDAGRSVIVMGDMNHQPRDPEFRLWAEAGLVDAAAKVAPEAGPALTCPSIEPSERIDYVFAAGPIAARLKSAGALFEGAFRTCAEDPKSFALSDHLPVLAVFE